MGIHLFVIRSWYFLAIAFVGTLHVSIPLAIATYYATREREPLTMIMFVPVFLVTLAYLNVNAMRAVIRSYGLTGEPEFLNMTKAVLRHVTLDTLFPFNIAFVISAAIAYGFRFLAGSDMMILGLFDPASADEMMAMIAGLQSVVQIDIAILINIFTVLPYIYPVILCLFGVSIASGAASASENPPGHLPIHGFAQKFWYIVATLLVNATLVGVLAGAAGLGALWTTMEGMTILPSIGFGIMGLILLLGYFNAYVVFALAYCAYEDERKEDMEIISHLRRYGMRDENLDVRALRQSRSKMAPSPAE